MRNKYQSIDCTFSALYKRFSRKIQTKSVVQNPFPHSVSKVTLCSTPWIIWPRLIGSRANVIDYFQILSWVSIDRFWRETTTSFVLPASLESKHLYNTWAFGLYILWPFTRGTLFNTIIRNGNAGPKQITLKGNELEQTQFRTASQK